MAELKPNEVVKRYEDMSVDGKLKLIQQRDGDMVLIVVPSSETLEREGGSPFGVSVEFCLSGGESPKVRKALEDLAIAIIESNKEHPQTRNKNG